MLLSNTSTSAKSLSNSTAVALLKQLFTLKNKNISKQTNEKVIKDALDIYNRIGGKRNYLVVNALLRLYLHYNYPENILFIWNDIEMVHNNVEYDILIQCYAKIKINDNIMFDINKGIQPLQWMKQNNYYNTNNLSTQQLKNYSIFVSKLLTNCETLQHLKHIHSLIEENQDIFIKTVLINSYHRFGLIHDASNIFNSIRNSDKDSVCINGMMKGLLNNGYGEQALLLYDEYSNNKDTRNNHIFYMMAIKCCLKTNNFEKGKLIHSNIKPSLCNNAMLATTLIDFYGHFGDFESANKIFNGINIKKKDQIMITSMIKCLVNNQCNQQALELYDKFTKFQDIMLHSFAIKACINTNNMEKGKLIIDHLKGSKEIKYNDLVHSTLIEFYGHFGDIDEGMNIFNSISNETKDVFCVGAIIKALINNDRSEDALCIYKQFGDLTDDKSHVLAIKACTNINDLQTGQNIIDSHYDQPENCSIEIITTLIDFYGTFGDISKANDIFNSISEKQRNTACFNAMMNVYCNNELNKECIELFNYMKNHNDIKLNSLSYTIALKACTQSTLLYAGIEIHEDLQQYNIDLLSDLPIQICLIGMYGKCGQLEACKAIFNHIKKKDFKRYQNEIKIWNALIHAFGRNGDIKDAMKTYYIMTDGIGLTADYKTFVVLLNSCCHSGEIGIARNLWDNEISDNMKTFVVATYIDCISRKEYLYEAYELVLKYDKLTMENNENDNKMMWMSLLNGCSKYKNNELAEKVYNEIKKRYENKLKHEDYMSAASQLLSNMFASV